MKKVGISICGFQAKYGDRRALEIAAEIGADAVDIDLCSEKFDYRNGESIYSKSDAEIEAYFKGLSEYAKELGIEISQTHGRIEGYKNIKEDDEALLKNARLDCLATSALGAPVCVMHGVTSIFMGPDADPRLMRDLNFNMFVSILPYAREYNVKIATETFGDAVRFKSCDFFGNIDEFLMTYNRIKAVEDFADYFFTCADTGHSNKAMRYNNPTAGNVIRMLGDSIKVLHLHDNDTYTDQHKIPRSGTIDWHDVLTALDEVGFDGVYNLELNLACFGKGIEIDTAAYGIKVMRNLLLEHYGE